MQLAGHEVLLLDAVAGGHLLHDRGHQGALGGDAGRHRIEFLGFENVLVRAGSQRRVGMRRIVRDHEHRVGVLDADGHVNGPAVGGVDAADQGQGFIRVLIALDPPVFDGVEHGHRPGHVDRTRFQVEMRGIVMRCDHSKSRGHGLGPDDDQHHAAVAAVHDEPGPRLHLPRSAELHEARGLCLLDRLPGGEIRAARDLEVGLVSVVEGEDFLALVRGGEFPPGLLAVPHRFERSGGGGRPGVLSADHGGGGQEDSQGEAGHRMHEALREQRGTSHGEAVYWGSGEVRT